MGEQWLQVHYILLVMLHNFSISLFSNQCEDSIVCIHDSELYVCACACKGCWV